jgi:predicted transposase YdaD
LKQEVVAAREENVELTADTPPRVDLVFHLHLADQRTCLFHVEFQGRRSQPPIPQRQLNHLMRLALRYDWPIVIESFVLYVEKYAGGNDTGRYEISRLDGTPALAWNYMPIHLWRQTAESLLTIDRQGIIPLISLTDIQQPDIILPQVIERLKAEGDEGKRLLLFANLLALMSDEEHIAMIEKLVESDELFTDTPYLRRIRREGREEGLQQGLIEAKQSAILKTVVIRFNPLTQQYLQMEQQIKQITDLELLDELFSAVLDANTVEEFTAVLENKREPK